MNNEARLVIDNILHTRSLERHALTTDLLIIQKELEHFDLVTEAKVSEALIAYKARARIISHPIYIGC